MSDEANLKNIHTKATSYFRNKWRAYDYISEDFGSYVVIETMLGKSKPLRWYARDFLYKERVWRNHIELGDSPENIEQIADEKTISDDFPEFENLSSHERSIMILHAIFGLSYLEISELFDLSVGAIKSRFFRIREKIKSASA